jgi:hypothetical protein
MWPVPETRTDLIVLPAPRSYCMSCVEPEPIYESFAGSSAIRHYRCRKYGIIIGRDEIFNKTCVY